MTCPVAKQYWRPLNSKRSPESVIFLQNLYTVLLASRVDKSCGISIVFDSAKCAEFVMAVNNHWTGLLDWTTGLITYLWFKNPFIIIRVIPK